MSSGTLDRIIKSEKDQAVMEVPHSLESLQKDNSTNPIYNCNNHTPLLDKNTWREKFSFILTKRFLFVFLFGQFLSFCLTAITITSIEIPTRFNVNIPTTQNLLNYILLGIFFTSVSLKKLGLREWIGIMRKRGWQYFLLALVDLQGNFFALKAYQFTSLLSIQILDATGIPVVVVLSIILLKVTYHWSQYLGILICVAGIVTVIKGDFDTKRSSNFGGTDYVKGDIFCIVGATFYALSVVGEEWLVSQFPIWEILGQLGLWGSVLTTAQLLILERKELLDITWSPGLVGFITAYSIAMFLLYSTTPQFLRFSSATFFNLSLLTSDVYGLFFGLYLYNYKMNSLYPISYACTMIGCTIYYIYPAPELKIIEKKEKDLNEVTERESLA
ncbi:hypothetical protein G9A89_005653 [Geosiphon pyriformis]|nr:hypothetical protein G9A89_005653 [Geosiphon pyriformis]